MSASPPAAAEVERLELRPGYDVARILNGGWQLSRGHRPDTPERGDARRDLVRLARAGFTTFDVADIYQGVESLLGSVAAELDGRIEVHTKLVPDLARLASLRRDDVVALADRSLRRLGVERLDLVQLHWWDYGVPGLEEVAGWLVDLRAAGKIRHLGATNFDVPHLGSLLAAGYPAVAHQVQYSLLDRRPERGMLELCRRHGVHLLAYGALAGGFLSDRYLGAADPTTPGNRSLAKYRLVIEELGGWEAFQALLAVLDEVARQHRSRGMPVSIANVAVRWVLDRPGVAGVVVGARTASHLDGNRRTFGLRLDDDDRARIGRFLDDHPGPSGDCFGLERAPGRHRALLKTDLNREG